MFLENIRLFNFKNYEEAQIDFSPQINSIVGENGSGKTNLLDAIHYLSLSKSAFNSIDYQNIRHEKDVFSIQGNFILEEEKYKVLCAYQNGQKKALKVNQKPYSKISEHIGRFPVVLIAPNDSKLITEGSEERRKFFDSIISQLDIEYLENLIQYNRVLKQRNAFLKQSYESQVFDIDLLNVYDEKMLVLGIKISNVREQFIQTFQPIFQKHYQNLSNQKEVTSLTYKSDFKKENYREVFKEARPKDRILQRSTKGIHKDDFVFEIETYSLKKFASQGQQKSFLIALKLTHFEIIQNQKKIKPLLLLDDIFDKLDDNRMNKLVEMVANDIFGQIFITDARPERTETVLARIESERKIIKTSELM